MARTGNYEIPFDKDGNQIGYAYHAAVMRPNFEFETALTFSHFSRGQSAAHAVFARDDDGTSVNVFLKDLEGFFPYFRDGAVKGTFTFTKRGQNYGCRLVKGV